MSEVEEIAKEQVRMWLKNPNILMRNYEQREITILAEMVGEDPEPTLAAIRKLHKDAEGTAKEKKK